VEIREGEATPAEELEKRTKKEGENQNLLRETSQTKARAVRGHSRPRSAEEG